MADLIDRKSAIDEAYAVIVDDAVYDVVQVETLEGLPSVEAEPVRHGHWLRTGRTNVYGGFEVECSVCNDNVMITNIEYEHYCRNCGARMDEGSE